MLNDKRILLRGASAYPHEQEAITFIRDVLPDRDPLLVWELVELVDPSTGHIHEIDALILGYRALYVVEIKSGPGVYRGDTVDWTRQAPGEPERFMKPPLQLTNFKSKVLKSLLARRMGGDRAVPWVQPLIFLSHQDVELQFRNYGDQCVVTRKSFEHAITHHKFPGSENQRSGVPVNKPQASALVKALEGLGVRPSAGGLHVGAWTLTETLDTGPGFVDRLAVHTENKSIFRRARSYLVPEQTSTEKRQQLRRAANREAQLLEDVKGHPGILRINDFVSDAEPGPTVLFDHFDALPLDAFLRKEKNLSFGERVELVAQVGRALDHCHKKEVYHGGLSPSAVLVRRNDKRELESRLYNFQLGGGAQVSHTVHWSALAHEDWAAYQAPELRENPLAPRGPADIFGLGALAYFILTGQAPADSAASADERMKQERHYDPRTVLDGLNPKVADTITCCTDWLPINRFDEPGEFVEYLLIEASAPDLSREEANPLEAKKGEILGDEFKVEGVLGQGASSRVLKVQKLSDGRSYALKVALNETEDERLSEEAAVLGSLRHQRIVQLHNAPTIGGRKCLVLALAGDQTLQRRLKAEGLISLDYAARFGEDLLLALEQLEEDKILHRDIKPANIGVGTINRKAQHLMLFDFSLGMDLNAKVPPRHARSELGLGTAAYRDPFLRDRGAWDHAADRYSAALVLHEMITGTRPAWTPEGASPRDPEASLVLAQERFDASVRDRLTAFFETALASNVAARHESALAMRTAWNACLATTVAGEVGRTSSGETSAHAHQLAADGAIADVPTLANPTLGVESSTSNESDSHVSASIISSTTDLSAIEPTAPIAELISNSRALNALDRAGVTMVGELAHLPDNQLSAVRGVGKRVIQQVVEITNAWKAARDQATLLSGPTFFPGYSGADTLLSECRLDDRLVRTITDAGLPTLKAVATAPLSQITRLIAMAEAKADGLVRVLKKAQAEGEQRAHPTSVDAWLRALLPKQKKRAENLKAIFGLSGPLAGRTDVLVAHAAKALGLTAPALYIALGKSKSEWIKHPEFGELSKAVHSVVDRAGGAVPVERAALGLLEHYPASPQLSEICADVEEERQSIVAAGAVLRIVGIVEKDDEAGVRWERLDETPWLLSSADLIEPVLTLGSAADELAAREIVASSGETVRFLRAAAESTSFAGLSDARLTELAAAASENAARSSRLEIYPRGLSARRALELSSSALVGQLQPDDIRRRVKARYQESTDLPDRPELDDLLRPLGLRWNSATKTYSRPEERNLSAHTRLPSSHGSFGSLSTGQRALHPDSIQATSFEESIRIALERGNFRVLSTRIDQSVDVALALAESFELEMNDLNATLWSAAQTLMKEHGVDEAIVHRADVAGPTGADWPQLTSLMTQAAAAVLADLLAEPNPRLLVNPGLLARYELDDFLRQLVHKSRGAEPVATFLLIPGRDALDQGVPRINDSLVIPEVGAPDALTVPPRWLQTQKQAS